MYIFGGLQTSLYSNNSLYTYDFETEKWEKIKYF